MLKEYEDKIDIYKSKIKLKIKKLIEELVHSKESQVFLLLHYFIFII